MKEKKKKRSDTEDTSSKKTGLSRDKKKSKGFGDVPDSQKEKVSIGDFIDLWKFPDNAEWGTVRFVGGIICQALYWIDIVTKDGKEISIPKVPLNFDTDYGGFDKNKECPYQDLPNKRLDVKYYANAIIRDLQDSEPKKKSKLTPKELKTGFKDRASDSWTPVRVIRVPSSLASKLKALRGLNKVKGVAQEISDPKYGIDVNLSFNKAAAGTDMYQVQKDERTPLTKEEREYLLYDLESALDKIHPLSLSDAKKDAEKLRESAAPTDEEEDYDEDDDDFDLDEKPKKKKKKSSDKESPKKKKKKPSRDDDDEDEEDERPRKKKKSSDESSKKKKKKK